MAVVDDPRPPVLRVEPWVLRAPVHVGMTTRIGFPTAGVGDDDQASRAGTREIVARGIGCSVADLAWVKQVHGRDVLDAAEGGLRGVADALVTDDPQRVLLVSVADCAPVALWDVTSNVRGIAHAGWRGTVAGVVEATIDAMVERGADRACIAAWIGPHIGAARFEVGPEVAAQFHDDDVLPAGEEGRSRPHVDLTAALFRRLRAAGIESLRASEDCTFDRRRLYWSYRRDGGLCGRQVAWIAAR